MNEQDVKEILNKIVRDITERLLPHSDEISSREQLKACLNTLVRCAVTPWDESLAAYRAALAYMESIAESRGNLKSRPQEGDFK